MKTGRVMIIVRCGNVEDCDYNHKTCEECIKVDVETGEICFEDSGEFGDFQLDAPPKQLGEGDFVSIHSQPQGHKEALRHVLED